MFVHFPSCWALFHFCLFLHVSSLFFQLFLVFFNLVFLKHFSFFVLVLECCSLLVPFYVSLFLKTLFGLNIDFLTFLQKKFSFYILSLLHKKAMVFFPFCAVSLFLSKKLFLVCWSSKESNVPLWFLFLVFSLLKKNLQNKLFLLVFEPSFLNHVDFFLPFILNFLLLLFYYLYVS